MWTRLWILFVCLSCVGCGSSESRKLVPVFGTCTYEDGSFIPGGALQLVFVPQDVTAAEGAEVKPGFATTDGDGIFSCVSTFKNADGALSGKHKVYIEALQGATPRVPKAYLSEQTTPLIIDTADSPLAIKIPKP